MKRSGKIVFTLLFFALLFTARQSKATHAFGAQLTYTCINSNTYVIWYTLYRDCSGIFPATTILINITNTCGFPAQSMNIPQVVSPIDLSPMCPQDVPTTCQGGIHMGVQKYIYSDTIVLGGACSNWKISHAESSRSSSLTTITGAGSDDLYVYCMINNTVGVNNSPVFTAEPGLYVCLGAPFSIDQGYFDVDGDSLTMQMITPLITAGSIVSYFSGYSGTQPLISNPPMSFNPVTGVLSGNPVQADFSVYAILVNEYRNGVLIGQVERDLSLIARSCTNNQPDMSGFDNTANYNITVLPNVQSCFTIGSFDPDAGQFTNIVLANSMSGLSFSHTSGDLDTATVCWTPTMSDSLNNPNCFTLEVTDDACPFTLTVSRTYCIDVSLIDNISKTETPSFEVYPNPFTENLLLTTDQSSEYEINMYDLSGREVHYEKFSGKTHQLNPTALESGVYLISIRDLNISSSPLWNRLVFRGIK
ncbi:MAG: T9SS type A sorting domain-containing protein [Bacteroidetes bacterium]|nr:T9SS type A sorting domain-containing protein [Bacteroidota bacterium]MBK7572252.1 T9SS type A sorting domain-containing protein [Bacteroidota bacterium]